MINFRFCLCAKVLTDAGAVYFPLRFEGEVSQRLDPDEIELFGKVSIIIFHYHCVTHVRLLAYWRRCVWYCLSRSLSWYCCRR